MATYPMIDMRDSFYSSDYVKNINNQPQHSKEIIDNHLKDLPHGPHPSTRDINHSSDRLAYAIIQRGRFLDFFGRDRSLFPMERLDDHVQLAIDFPCLWLQHGTDDTEVPIEGSQNFVSKLRSLNPRVSVRYCELEVMGHGTPSEIYLITSGKWSEGIKSLDKILGSGN
jgi:hypothetical protein